MWQCVAKLSEISLGEGRPVQCAGVTLALFNQGGEIYALDNTCPHRGGPLGEGALDGDLVTCPWHAWAFNIKTGACQVAPDLKQKTYPVKIDQDDILVDF